MIKCFRELYNVLVDLSIPGISFPKIVIEHHDFIILNRISRQFASDALGSPLYSYIKDFEIFGIKVELRHTDRRVSERRKP